MQLDARSDLYSLALGARRVGDRPGPVRGRHHHRHAHRAHAASADRARGARPARRRRSTAPAALDPDDRYPDAGTMRQALADVGESLPPPGPLLLAGMVDHADPHPTRVAAPAGAAVVRPGRGRSAARAERRVAGAPSRRRRSARAASGRPVSGAWCRSSSRSCCWRPSRSRPRRSPGSAARPRCRSRASSGATTAGAPARSRRARGSRPASAPQAAPDPTGVVIGQSPGPGSWTSARHVRARRVVGPGAGLGAADRGPAVGERQEAARRDRLRVRHAGAGSTARPSRAARCSSVTPAAGHARRARRDAHGRLSKGHAPVPFPTSRSCTYADAVDGAHRRAPEGPRAARTCSRTTCRQGEVVSTLPAAGQPAPYGSTVAGRSCRTGRSW